MIGLVFCGDLKYCPYIKRYIEILEDRNIDYKVYFWNRSGLDMDLPDNYFYCETKLGLDAVGLKKIKGFLDFRRWVVKKLKKDDIDKVIVLSTLSGILVFDELLKRKQDYIFDIRDYSYEHFKPFFLIEKRIIKNSFFTAISSEGFKVFLPEHDYVIAHNFNINDKKGQYYFKRNKKPLKIVWNGVMRFFDYQKQYLDALKNDERFLLVYHGDGPELEKYKCYCKENGFNNVIFTGAYNNEDKERLLRDADILNNCYGYVTDAGNKLKYAVSNRFYDGIIYHIPQLVEPEGFKSDWAVISKVGNAMSVGDDFADEVYAYYNSIEEDLFDVRCDMELEKIIQDDAMFVRKIDRFIVKEE